MNVSGMSSCLSNNRISHRDNLKMSFFSEGHANAVVVIVIGAVVVVVKKISREKVNKGFFFIQTLNVNLICVLFLL